MKDAQIAVQPLKVGRVKAFDHDRGFGFVLCWDDLKEYFVHITKISTGQLDLGDLVMFDLSPSRKKPGTMEAVRVSLVSESFNNPEFLKESYFRFKDLDFRKQVLKALKIEDVFSIIKNEAAAFKGLENKEQVEEYIKVATRLLDSIEAVSLKNGINKILFQWAENISNNYAKIFLWLDGTLAIRPDDEVIEKYFAEADLTTKAKIFVRVEDHLRKQLGIQFIESSSPLESLEFLSQFVKNHNNLDSYNFKRKLREPSFWEDKQGYSLLNDAFTHYNKTLSDQQMLKVCLEGYPVIFPENYVFAVLEELTNEEISKIISGRWLLNESGNQFYSDLIKIKSTSDSGFAAWLYRQVKGIFTEEELSNFDKNVQTLIPAAEYFSLWESGIVKTLPRNFLKEYLLMSPPIQKIETWNRMGKITSTEIIELNIENIISFKNIDSRKHFYSFHACITVLRRLNVNEEQILNACPTQSRLFYSMSLWLEKLDDLNYKDLKPLFLYLSHEHQIWFLKGMFGQLHTGKLAFDSIELLSLMRVKAPKLDINEVGINVSIAVIINAIQSLAQSATFLVDYDLIAIALKTLEGNKTYKLQIGDLFEQCHGRTEAEYNWRTSGEVSKILFGSNQFYFAISIPTRIKTWSRFGGERWVANEHFETLKDAIKQIPGRKYNAEKEHWGVPSSQENSVLEYARANRFFLNLGSNNYSNNPHLAEFKTGDVPSGINFCEGRLANTLHQTFQREFWWCCNQPCFQNCETIHSPDQWKDYSLLDFLLIMGFQLDDVNRAGDYIDKSKYYQFISSINRFNRLLERMYCHECNQILCPVEDSHFAHYRVVRFSCQNVDCEQCKKEIYLHHCMNGKCNGIIDSRVSKKCPNGLYICSNDKCGCCCSNDMFQRRLDNLKTTGGKISDGLLSMVNQRVGHVDKDERYCYKCGERMIGKEGHYNCQACGLHYDVSMTKPTGAISKRKTATTESNVDF